MRTLECGGLPVFMLAVADLQRLAPTVILTQSLCDVCAVIEGDVRSIETLLDPLFSAGHWTPELVRRAGGIDVLAAPGAHSVTIAVDQIRNANPELLLFAPCGFDVVRSAREAAFVMWECRRVESGATAAFRRCQAPYRPSPFRPRRFRTESGLGREPDARRNEKQEHRERLLRRCRIERQAYPRAEIHAEKEPERDEE